MLVALLQTPHRFRTKRQLWAYSGVLPSRHTIVVSTAMYFDQLIAEGYTADEVESVLRHHDRERLAYFAYRDPLEIWNRSWRPNHESKSRAA